MKDEDGNRTKFDKKGRGTDVDGYDRAGVNKYGLPKGVSVEDVGKMEQDELTEKMKKATDSFWEVLDKVEIEMTPAERMLRTYVEHRLDPTLTKEEAIDEVITKLFNLKNGQKVTDAERKAFKKIMKSAIKVAKDYDKINIESIVDASIESVTSRIKERTMEAKKGVDKGKSVINSKQASQILSEPQQIVEEIEKDFEEDL